MRGEQRRDFRLGGGDDEDAHGIQFTRALARPEGSGVPKGGRLQPGGGERRQNLVDLPHSVGQAGRTRLEDVGRLDLENPVVAHRARRIPARPRLNGRLLHLLAAPRREDDLRIAPRDLGRIDDAIPGRGRPSRAPGRAARRRRSSTSSSTQRMPEISGSSHSSKNTRRRCGNRDADSADAIEIRFQRDRRAARLPAGSRRARRASRIICRISATLRWLNVTTFMPRRTSSRDEIRLQIGERQHEVRLQRLDLVELRVDERRHLRLEPRLGRTDGVAGDADDAITLAEEVERLGRFFGQTDDARRISRHRVIG